MAFVELETHNAKSSILTSDHPIIISVHSPGKQRGYYSLVISLHADYVKSLGWKHHDKIKILYDRSDFALLLKKDNSPHARSLIISGTNYSIKRAIMHGHHNEPYPEKKMNGVRPVTYKYDNDLGGLYIKLPKPTEADYDS